MRQFRITWLKHLQLLGLDVFVVSGWLSAQLCMHTQLASVFPLELSHQAATYSFPLVTGSLKFAPPAPYLYLKLLNVMFLSQLFPALFTCFWLPSRHVQPFNEIRFGLHHLLWVTSVSLMLKAPLCSPVAVGSFVYLLPVAGKRYLGEQQDSLKIIMLGNRN